MIDKMAVDESSAKICIAVLIGIPGSGKTTFARLLQTKLTKSPFYKQVTVLSYDDIFPSDFRCIVEEGKWKTLREEVVLSLRHWLNNTLKSKGDGKECEYMMSSSTSASNVECKVTTLLSSYQLNRPLIIIIDDNMFYRSMRYRYYQVCREYGLHFCQFYLRCSSSWAKSNNQKRDSTVKETVIDKMSSQLEEPQPQQNEWESLSMVVDATNVTASEVNDFLCTALSSPIPSLEVVDKDQQAASRLICLTNVIHQADKILRKLVGRRLATLDKKGRKELSVSVNKQKQELLKEIKENKIIPFELQQRIQMSEPGCLDDLELLLWGAFCNKLYST